MRTKDELLGSAIGAFWLNYSNNPDDLDSFWLFRNEIAEIANDHAKRILEDFISDHFPLNSKDCKTALSAKIGNLEPGECFSFTAFQKQSGESDESELEDTPIPGASKKLNKLIKKIRKHRE